MKRHFLLLYGGAIGDSLVGMHAGRTIAANLPGEVLELISTRKNAFTEELCSELPFIRFRSLPKESIASWCAILSLAFRRNISIVYEPVSAPMSPWWKLILWFARRVPGSIELHYQMRGYEWPVPSGAIKCVYDCEHLSLFDSPARILDALGLPSANRPSPTFPRRQVSPGSRYIIFHFFAGQVRRSIPVSHAREILVGARSLYPDHGFIVTCDEREQERAARMIEGMPGVCLEAGRSARELVALLSGADLVVGTASGIIILAAHLSVPVISLSCLSHRKAFLPDFSPRSIILAARDECRCRPGDGSVCPLMTDEGPVYRCLYYIRTEDVLAAMESVLPVQRGLH